ncbi:O-glucosyltransferase rumi homolog [Chenopodium quinoa]|uniref:O-glucosyltransferase rumi homolog n=1 Tax=Chenopodium quinoa TaxID=63459 RepID=UPI000B78ED1E|nr:O-glucosyltransferase rumi homolog [Chenopodium quinoa]
MAMGLRSKLNHGNSSLPRSPPYLFSSVCLLAFLSLAALLVLKVDDVAYQTKTVAGHNLKPTPWHLFEPKVFDEGTSYSRATKIVQCQYFQCRSNAIPNDPQLDPSKLASCPAFFRYIHRDLAPWSKSRISLQRVMEAKEYAAFRVVIVGGRLFVDFYYACVQSRMMFTVWGLLQLLKRYPGLVPDVDLMFDCMDKPAINRTEHRSRPLPLFRYCTTNEHFDIPFPDWSFWGWPEVNVGPWDAEFRDIKRGSRSRSWPKKWPYAYWKGNPDVGSPIRSALLECNNTKQWRTQILRQDWGEEARAGYKKSKLSSQCDHRYKIYAEGYAWSVSLKYILSCGSLTLLIAPQYEDFFTRGLLPKKNYWPVPRTDLCPNIKQAVDWGNSHPAEAAAMGKAGQDYMDTLNMDRVYDYMFHLLMEYSKLQDFKPIPPSSAQEVCIESLLCFAEPKQKQFLEQSATSLASMPPCVLPNADGRILKRWKMLKERIMKDVAQQT